MNKFKKLLCVLMALCMMASLSVAVCAAETDKPVVDTENDKEILDMTHLDVKADAVYCAEIDGEAVALPATVVAESIVVTVDGKAADYVYNFASYNVYTITEGGMTEYRIILDGTDGAMLNAIEWDGYSFRMNNVYVSAKLILADVPEVLAAELEANEDGTYSVDVSFRYTGIQECTGHNGLRSEGHNGMITGVDLYLNSIPGMSVETPVPETTIPEPTETEPVPTETEPAPTETEPVPTETEPAKPETDDVPETGDSSMTMILVLLGVSVIGMAATAVIGKKLKYVGKWQ